MGTVDGELEPIRFERAAEIRRWLQLSDTPWREWVALDDMHRLFPPFCRQLVTTDPTIGLTLAELDRVAQKLGLAVAS